LEPKWIRELQERFQINAEKADADDLLAMYDRFRRRPQTSFALVASYTSLRPYKDELSYIRDDNILSYLPDYNIQEEVVSNRARFLKILRAKEDDDLTPGASSGGIKFFDMVVFDEAHWMRTTGTSTYEMGENLSWASKAVVCLSATPVHNTSRDLYALLRLIDPDVFRNQFVFEQLRNQNLPFIQFHNLLGQPGCNLEKIQEKFDSLPECSGKEKIRDLLDHFDDTPEKRVELLHVTEKLNLLENFINRTRKRDVIGNRVLRQPKTLQVMLSPEEAVLYETVLEQVRVSLAAKGEQVTSFHLISPALQMASSLPVIAEDFKNGRWGSLEQRELQNAEWSDELIHEKTNERPQVLQKHLLAYDFIKNDSKYKKLKEILLAIGSEKVLLSDNPFDNRTVKPEDRKIVINENPGELKIHTLSTNFGANKNLIIV